jgi:Tfp pilus assembly protein FimT
MNLRSIRDKAMILRGQRGTTLSELLLGIGIAALFMPIVTAGVFQISRGSVNTTTDIMIQRDLENASSWLTRDLANAQTTNLVDGNPPINTLSASWIDETGWSTPGQETHSASYSLSGTSLQRNYDGVTHTIANNVEGISFSRDGDFITISITSTFRGESESMSYFISPRPDEAIY